MGLLHSPGLSGVQGALWEVQQLAQAAGIPLPPPLQLPSLPPLVGGCDAQALAAALGAEVAQALGEQLQLPGVQQLLTGDLAGARSAVLGYLGTLDTLRGPLLADLADGQGTLGALGQAQDTLSGLRAALGQPGGSALAGDVISAVADACPAVGGLLAYAEGTLAGIEQQVQGVSSALSAGLDRLNQLTSLQGAAEALLAELDAHVDIQAALLDVVNGMNFGGGP
ncbi:hypothetical protein [Deinococcus radiotolerans]|uniref:Uncharacterized protein n=1 Tax=Deinococcus radiotolerans TaxID=1309407 RepID=A0ABQ2FQ57_9DEIO|nr:hypothetical protein [Deinococcus radiotolerans]GGL15952.1 hypothetical protein GCM10010844_38560 [Deinococcus radiotolerans]